MHDLKTIREDPGAFDRKLGLRGLEPRSGVILDRDERRRACITELQQAQTRRNEASKQVGKAKGSGDKEAAERLIAEVGQLKAAIQTGEETDKKLSSELDDLLAGLPNLPADDVPVGDESANKVLREIGRPPKFDFQPKQHFDLGEALGLMDFEAASKMSGARFVVLKGALARLERALAAFMLDLHTGEFGYDEIAPPVLVKDHAVFGTGQLPKFEEDLFYALSSVLPKDIERVVQRGKRKIEDARREEREIAAEDAEMIEVIEELLLEKGVEVKKASLIKRYVELLRRAAADSTEELHSLLQQYVSLAAPHDNRRWLIPTAEVPLTNMVREDILDESVLPLRYTAWTPCFRAEAGAAGKDTRGMIRQHQFSKVELVSITTPEQSAEEHERMTSCAEEVLKRLGLAYRMIVLSTGDMGFSARKTYDIEVWLPGQGAYREISSCSVCGDFQARRMNTRYRPKDSKALRFVHTLNGSGLAVGRTLIAILENYQNADGSITIPDALQPYMGGMTKITAA